MKGKKYTRKEYKAMIYTYKKRRETMRGHLAALTKKLSVWEAAAKKLEKKKVALDYSIEAIASSVREFTGVDVKEIGSNFSIGSRDMNRRLVRDIFLACGMFSKFGMENGIIGADLSRYMARPNDTAGRLRFRFTQSWAKYPENREKYQNFKRIIEEEQE